MSQVKTYRVLKHEVKVGDSVRNFGDFMPEAAEFDNLRTLLNVGIIEETWIDESVLSSWEEGQKARDAERLSALQDENSDSSTPPESDEDGGEDKKPKKVVKKTAAKKTAKKKVTKNARRAELTEASV